MSAYAVEARGVSKRFGATMALDDVSLAVSDGELFGLIGPDGAGKTTLFRIRATLMVPDAGEARVLGLDVVRDLWAIRRQVGYMPGRFSLYPDLSVEENLRFFAAVFGTTLEAGERLVAPIWRQIAPFAGRRAGALSGGMKQKLSLCCALIHEPEVLLLDEPTFGVDPISRRELWHIVHEMVANGMTAIVSTAYLDEAERCDRVALLSNGKLAALDAPAELQGRLRGRTIAIDSDAPVRAMELMRAQSGVRSAALFGQSLHLTLHSPGQEPELRERV